MSEEVRIHHGQRYTRVGEETYTRQRDGAQASFLVWETACANCGRLFRVRTTEGAPTFAPSRRCYFHKKPGLQAKVSEPPPSTPEPQEPAALAAPPEVEQVPASPPPEPAFLFAKGDRVSHPKFGSGVVLGVAEWGLGDHYAEVLFDEHGTKIVLDSFLDPLTATAAPFITQGGGL